MDSLSQAMLYRAASRLDKALSEHWDAKDSNFHDAVLQARTIIDNVARGFGETEVTAGDVLAAQKGVASLRDYFAANAMQGQHANPECGHLTVVDMAKVAYLQADAMLAAREQQ